MKIGEKIGTRIIQLTVIPLFFLIYFFLVAQKKFKNLACKKKKKPRLVWGPIPLINNKYWSNALKKEGYDSNTFMIQHFDNINQKDDFDKYTYDLPLRNLIRGNFWNKIYFLYVIHYYSFLYAIRHYDIFHHHFCGGYLGQTVLWKYEAQLLKFAGCKTIITPYGADAYLYSKIIDLSLRQALLMYYPTPGKSEDAIEERVRYWVKHADIILNGLMLDGIGRWDVTVGQFVTIDTSYWLPKQIYSKYNGKNGVVKIIHTPNNRSIKGTEFIIQAVKELKEEGLKIELILMERVKNDKVNKVMRDADIHVDQLIFGYALSAIEGMASGLPELSNLVEEYIRPFKRYSFMNECPIISTSPETIKFHLRTLIKNPKLREKLGKAGRKFVEKYHSEKTAQYIFGSIYNKIWYGKDTDLMKLFHPLLSDYNKLLPIVKHPLVDNMFSKSYYKNI